ncbi:hypothetical protein [Cumulibacter soli]|uniref:hypothetical protein n=1 Tax=Cumulibacter soli TaxID=2546344 RepID=UPI00141979B5|nr:hypothetical protein [Cumulibacter soli]
MQNIEHSRNNTKDLRGRPGAGNPTMDTVFQLANALQVDVSFLIFGNGNGDIDE